ncbi:DUF4124 domain-containing protein [Xylella fastidiosa]|uniref:DUF4124 domain-containing protein n=1 Tax=Xylella fastidiosa TaxID=2371 RepID=UPI000983574E|nr:DUF4124 domain-containing protein [Xylella fastidiosa]WGZ33729.1 DUF4124 domain-containing protein [Xylella fastidiosa subsp. pauca]WGZ36052.1 DUF4124 domain-containing protein [Xylella fastidiosa subsp. pauca]
MGINRLYFPLFLFISYPVFADQLVYKCLHKGHVSYQSQPCSSGVEAKTWKAVPDPPVTNAELWRRYRIDQELQQRYANDRLQRSVPRSLGSSIPVHSSSCDAARKQRAVLLDEMGVNRSYGATASLDNAVNAACR